MMFISEISGDTNFSLALFTMLIHWMVNYINSIDHFTNSDEDRSNGFETYCYSSKTVFRAYLILSLLFKSGHARTNNVVGFLN